MSSVYGIPNLSHPTRPGVRPPPPTHRPGDPREYWYEKGKNGDTLTPINHTVLPLPQPQDAHREDDGEEPADGKRQWHIPDFALCACPQPTEFTVLAGGPTRLRIGIDFLIPSLPEKKAIVPVIIEVKAQSTNDIDQIKFRLGAAHHQLEEQASYTFADFPWQNEVIAIAGCGIYWTWKLPTRDDVGSGSGSPYVLSGSDADDIDRDLPFMLGTEPSNKEISQLLEMVSQTVEEQGWELDDPIEQQGEDFKVCWEIMVKAIDSARRERGGSGGGGTRGGYQGGGDSRHGDGRKGDGTRDEGEDGISGGNPRKRRLR